MKEDTGLEDFGTDLDELGNKGYDDKCIPTPAIQGGDSLKGEREIINLVTLTQWAIVGQNTFKPVSTTYPKLEAGMYNIQRSDIHGLIFEKKSVCIDDLLKFPDSLSEKIYKEIDLFWKREQKFRERGYLHRRGILLHGPAGGGKTSIVQQIVADIINSDGLVFHCTTSPEIFSAGLSLYRKVEPNRPVVVLFEDIDAIIDRCGEESILDLLDGENQIDKCLNLATTNYPEKLDKRLVARPRRFDRVIKIGMPSEEVRKMYFSKKLNIPEESLMKWTKASDGFSFAACAELVILVECFGKDFDESVNYLKDMMRIKISSADYNDGPKGFGIR